MKNINHRKEVKSMFNKNFEKWNRPKSFWYADIMEGALGDFHCCIHKIRIYGYEKRVGSKDKKNYLRLFVKRKVGSISDPTANNKLKMTYQTIPANCIDKDLSFVVETCIEAKRQGVKRRIQKLQEMIDDIPDRKKRIEKRKDHLQSILDNNKITKDNFFWSDRDINSQPKKLNISDKYSDDNTMYTFD
tara:strand:- start:118 stop:684 length:567 start_codon:yes stop_codon:yes gene_type:complete